MYGFVLWLQQVVVPSLGPHGMFVVAFFDSSFVSIPEVNDVFVVTWSAARPEQAWLFILATTLGSVAGCSALWLVGKRGGEPLLVRKFGAERVEWSRGLFNRWNVLALAVPALLPPPMPFKVFVFSAGVFGVPFRRFLITIALARGLRYFAWGAMGMLFGAGAMDFLRAFDAWFAAHVWIVALTVVALGAAALVQRRFRREPAL